MNFYAKTPQMIKFRNIVTEAITDFQAITEGSRFLISTMGLDSDIADEIIDDALCMRTVVKFN